MSDMLPPPSPAMSRALAAAVRPGGYASFRGAMIGALRAQAIGRGLAGPSLGGPGLIGPGLAGPGLVGPSLAGRGVVRSSLAGRGVAPVPDGLPPLPAAVMPGTTTQDDWLLALLDAWAMVGEILAFYQVRIAAEAFLPTAQEDVSIHRLLRSVGYEMAPGFAATARVSFAMAPAPDPDTDMPVPAGTRLQTVPTGGEQPVMFETDVPLLARAAWNQIPVVPPGPSPPSPPGPAPGPAPPPLDPLCDSLVLTGPVRSIGPGAVLAITGVDAAGTARSVLRTVRLVTEQPSADPLTDTLVALVPATGQAPAGALQQVTVMRFALRTTLFGAQAAQFGSLPDVVKARYAPIRGGVARLAAGQTAWQTLNDGLTVAPAGCLVVTPAGTLLAGGPDGILRQAGAGWAKANTGLASRAVTALTAGADGTVYCGTAAGRIFRSRDDGVTWEDISGLLEPAPRFRLPLSGAAPGPLPAVAVRAIAIGAARTALLAATDAGIFYAASIGQGWQPAGKGLPGWDGTLAGPVVALAVAGGQVFAGRSDGVYSAATGRGAWRQVSAAPGSVLQLLVAPATPVPVLFARGPQGLQRSQDLGRTWTPVWPPAAAPALPAEPPAPLALPPAPLALPPAPPAPPPAPLALPPAPLAPPPALLSVAMAAVGEATHLYAGTDAGLYQSVDLGQTWTAVAGATTTVALLAAGADGSLARSGPLLGVTDTEWSGFTQPADYIDLSVVADGIVSGSTVALIEALPDGTSRSAIYTAGKVANVTRSDFGLSRMVTRIGVAPPDPALGGFGLRDTEVLAVSQALPYHPPPIVPPIGGTGQPITVVPATADAPKLPPDREVVLTGLAPVVPPQIAHPLVAKTLGSTPASRGPVPAHNRRPVRRAIAGAVLPQRHATNRRVIDGGSPDPIVLASSGPAGLEQMLQGEGLAIHGNVVSVTQGRTLDDEILGRGNATQANQSFRLAVGPLTYTAGGTQPALKVLVDGVEWTRVETLSEAAPDDRVYMLLRDLDGRVSVLFGCGINGARLPTGREVVARYRVGIGAPAPQPGTVTTVLRSSARIAAVTNLEPGQAGAPAESLADARRSAAGRFSTRDRLVTRGDYETFAAGFPGVGAALAQSVATPLGILLAVAVVPADLWSDAPGSSTADLVDALRAAMLARSARPEVLRVLPATLQHVAVRLTGRLLPGARQETVQADAGARLAGQYGFGGAVSVAGIAVRLRGLPNVTGLSVASLDGAVASLDGANASLDGAVAGLDDAPDAPRTEIVPDGGGWDAVAWALRPAAVLVIEQSDTQADVTLDVTPNGQPAAAVSVRDGAHA